jgi:hypothetical protein
LGGITHRRRPGPGRSGDLTFSYKYLQPFCPDFVPQRQSVARDTSTKRIFLQSMNVAQQTINSRINALEAGQPYVSAQHPAIGTESSTMRQSVNRLGRELCEVPIALGPINSTLNRFG